MPRLPVQSGGVKTADTFDEPIRRAEGWLRTWLRRIGRRDDHLLATTSPAMAAPVMAECGQRRECGGRASARPVRAAVRCASPVTTKAIRPQRRTVKAPLAMNSG
jgi:hypothetical protein